MKQYDTIFVGSGIGALVAAATLAQKGKKILVIEKHVKVGGYAHSFKRKGYTFDASLHQLGGVFKTGLHKILSDAGVIDSLTFLKAPYLSELLLPNGELIQIPNGELRAYQSLLIKKYPHEEKGIRTWFTYIEKLGKQLHHYDKRENNFLLQGSIDAFAPLLYPLVILTIARKTTLSSKLIVKDSQLRNILLHFSLYYGLPADRINALFPTAANYSYYSDGGYYIKGGGAALSEACANSIRKNGGTILTATEVSQVIVENDRATGVVASDKTYHSSEIIISASPYHFYKDLVPQWGRTSQELATIKRLEIGMSCSVLYIATDIPIEAMNSTLKDAYEYTLLSPLHENDYYNLFENKHDFNEDYHTYPKALSFHSTIDPSCLPPEGGACFDLFIPDNYDRWAALSPEEYRTQKEIEIKKLIIQLEKVLPSISDHIIVAELGTPKTMERYTGNPKGALYGFAQSIPQTLHTRFSNKSPISGVHFISAWTSPGGGYEGSIRSASRYLHPTSKWGYVVTVIIIGLMIYLPYILLTSLLG